MLGISSVFKIRPIFPRETALAGQLLFRSDAGITE